MTWNELLNIYTTDLIARNSRPSYIKSITRAIRRFLKYISSAPDSIKPSDVTEYISTLYETLAPTTVALHRGQVCVFLNWLSTEEYIAQINWSKRIPQVKTDESDPKTLANEQVKRLLIAVDVAPHLMEIVKRRDLAMIYVLADTGIRRSELLRLKISDVDLVNGEISISSEAKGRKSRLVWISEETIAVLKRYLRLRRQRPGSNLWVTKLDTTPSSNLILRSLKKYARLAGINEITIHEMRHTALTQMARNGMGLAAVRAVAGHSVLRTTEKYLHLASEDVKREAKKHSPIKAWV